MRVLVIENFIGTPPGVVGQALREAGAEIDLRQAHLGEPIPENHAGYDGIVILGGGQSAIDDDDHPYLPALAALTRQFGEADKAVLGICLGAQLVARGYGAENILGRPIEFGWHEVRPTAEGSRDPVLSAMNGGTPIFHWHTDTFTLPPGATHLAISTMTENQAFRLGTRVYGIQFHFEADRALVSRWSEEFAGQIVEYAPDWQDRLPAEAARHGERADAAGLAIARAWTALIGS
jgi:GMP synthase (glutamine-hydrolysing)